jgi:hypothetical protein
MTTPPLPETNCVRVRLDYTIAEGTEAGSRFYVSYNGSAPSSATLNTLASDIATAWNANIAAVVGELSTLTEIDILDISTLTGASGSWTGSHAGTMSGDNLPIQCASNVEYDIARRYRGGKPRMFIPPPDISAMVGENKWSAGHVANLNTAVSGFMAAIAALSPGSMGVLAHVNVSYYQGFTNVTNSSGRTRAAPKYRTPTALVEPVTGYAAKATIGSQRRRRLSTTY